MAGSAQYVIRGGCEGRERLRILARVMRSSSVSLLDRLGLTDGLECLDAGCGGGDVTLELARRVAPRGSVLGIDIDATKLEIARAEAADQRISNVEFRVSNIGDGFEAASVDFVYSRFLLTHLSDPARTVRAFYSGLCPGGRVAIEDIDFSGYFTYPESKAFRRYHELYCTAVQRRGGDPNLGPRLPGLLKQAGFEDVGMGIVQPIASEGEAKLLNPLTMENIAGAVLADGLASQDEIERVVRELYEFAADPSTIAGAPRVVQVWGRRPEA